MNIELVFGIKSTRALWLTTISLKLQIKSKNTLSTSKQTKKELTINTSSF